MGKILGHIDLKAYFEWYANYAETTVEKIVSGKRGVNPTNMISDWLDFSVKCEKPCEEFIGKEVYFSINREHRDKITYDTWLEGCSICKGVVEKIVNNSITINGTTYDLPEYHNGLLFDCKEYCLLYLHYDGDGAMIDVSIEGDIFINDQYSDELVVIECE